MAGQRCACNHPYSIHRLNRQIGNRNECWAAMPGGGWCSCRQFQEQKAAAQVGAAKPEGS